MVNDVLTKVVPFFVQATFFCFCLPTIISDWHLRNVNLSHYFIHLPKRYLLTNQISVGLADTHSQLISCKTKLKGLAPEQIHAAKRSNGTILVFIQNLAINLVANCYLFFLVVRGSGCYLVMHECRAMVVHMKIYIGQIAINVQNLLFLYTFSVMFFLTHYKCFPLGISPKAQEQTVREPTLSIHTQKKETPKIFPRP